MSEQGVGWRSPFIRLAAAAALHLPPLRPVEGPPHTPPRAKRQTPHCSGAGVGVVLWSCNHSPERRVTDYVAPLSGPCYSTRARGLQEDSCCRDLSLRSDNSFIFSSFRFNLQHVMAACSVLPGQTYHGLLLLDCMFGQN